MSTPNAPDDSRALVIFKAKLPDDTAIEEFAALVDAISVIDGQIVESVISSPEAEFINSDLRAVEPSIVTRVRYGSDFEVVLTLVGQIGVGVGVLAGIWVGVTKGLDSLASSRLRNEERLAKRDERLARSRARASTEQVLAPRISWISLWNPELTDLVGVRPVAEEDEADRLRQARVQEALETLIPADVRQAAQQALPDAEEGARQRLMIALTVLAEYRVTTEVVADRSIP